MKIDEYIGLQAEIDENRRRRKERKVEEIRGNQRKIEESS